MSTPNRSFLEDDSSQRKTKRKRRFCRVEGCGRVVKSQGLCQGHGAKPKICKMKGCNKQTQGGFYGMCKLHFKDYYFRDLSGDAPIDSNRVEEVANTKPSPKTKSMNQKMVQEHASEQYTRTQDSVVDDVQNSTATRALKLPSSTFDAGPIHLKQQGADSLHQAQDTLKKRNMRVARHVNSDSNINQAINLPRNTAGKIPPNLAFDAVAMHNTQNTVATHDTQNAYQVPQSFDTAADHPTYNTNKTQQDYPGSGAYASLLTPLVGQQPSHAPVRRPFYAGSLQLESVCNKNATVEGCIAQHTSHQQESAQHHASCYLPSENDHGEEVHPGGVEIHPVQVQQHAHASDEVSMRQNAGMSPSKNIELNNSTTHLDSNVTMHYNNPSAELDTEGKYLSNTLTGQQKDASLIAAHGKTRYSQEAQNQSFLFFDVLSTPNGNKQDDSLDTDCSESINDLIIDTFHKRNDKEA